MGAKIHLYPLERFTFGDDDYYDIDYFDGLIYQTAKIKGSTIKAGIIAGLPSVDTIYNADGTINSDRTITGTNSNQLLFDQFRKFVFNTNPGPFGTPGYEINGGVTGPFLRVKNAVTGVSMLDVSTSGVRINSDYTLPLNDGTAGQFLVTDGNGNLSWATSTASGDMLKSQYDPNNSGVVLSARKITVEFINKTGATLTKGTIVYLKSTSASGTHPEALKADATTEATSSKTIGAVFEDTANDAIGKIVTSGEVENLDTSAFSIGTKLWLSTTPGQVTATPPTQPNHTVFIGTVTRSQNVNGRILYTIQNGYELEELHDVLISATPANGDVLAYNSTTQLWENVPINIPAPFIPPDIRETEIRRGVIAVSGSTSQGTYGALSPINTGSLTAVSFGGTTRLPKFRLLTTAGSTNSTVGIAFGNSGLVHTVGWGFRFVGSWIYSDQSAGGTNWFVPGARQFVGLSASGTILGIASGVTVESQTNIIGIGSDASDVNLQIFHNDGTGTATKIDLGANFPANKTGAVANGEAYQLELYNEFGQTSVKYRVRKLSDGTETTGTITTNLPSGGIGPQIVRTSGTTSQNVSIDVIQITANTRE